MKKRLNIFDEDEEEGGAKGQAKPKQMNANDALEFALSKPSRVARQRAGTVGKAAAAKPKFRLEDHLGSDSDDGSEGQQEEQK